MARKASGGNGQRVESLKHADKRKNIPTAEYQAVLKPEEQKPIEMRYPRNKDLDPQLMWRGKDEQDWSDLVVHAPPLYIQEKVHPKVLIDDLLRRMRAWHAKEPGHQADMFADFNGLPKNADKTDFYHHDQNWSNRMILGDSLQVMASLAEREGLRGKVQCIYLDPPYGIKFNSNFQWSTTSRDVKDGNVGHITREPEQVKAFRDTWRDGIHSYLTYLRDRLTVARDLLAESGSIFVQIGDENVHRVRVLLDEVFGDENCVAQITVKKTSGATSENLPGTTDFVLFYAKSIAHLKYRQMYLPRQLGDDGDSTYTFFQDASGQRRRLTSTEVTASKEPTRICRLQTMTSQSLGRSKGEGAASWFPVELEGRTYRPSMSSRWKTNETGMRHLMAASRLAASGNSLSYIRFHGDFPVFPVTDLWVDTQSGSAMEKTYVVQTSQKIVERCLLMATDPGDLVLDPTCGSGTTAYVAEQWGRRWITVDTSRVALALARARIMGARYPFYLLADSRDGQLKEGELTRSAPSTQPVHGDIRHGFVYERVPHITLRDIANNAEIDVIWEKHQAVLDPIRDRLNSALKKKWHEWEIPREADGAWSDAAKKLHAEWWKGRLARQSDIDASIAAKAGFEYLYDKPYPAKKIVRVAGPFTVESLSPHRVLGVGADDELLDALQRRDSSPYGARQSFPEMILDNLKVAGVQQAHKEDRITFKTITRWPGYLVCAEGRYMEGDAERRAAIFIGPEFGTVQRVDLVAAAREAGEAGFDVLVACAFNYEAHTTEFNKLGRLPVLKARMNADLHMAEDLKTTSKGNLFVVFGEPDVRIHEGESAALRKVTGNREARIIELRDVEERLKSEKDPKEKERLGKLVRERQRHERFLAFAKELRPGQIVVEVWGVDVFKPQSGEVQSDDVDGIACWFIDTDYNEESFFVRHAYFLGANDPYSALRTTLRAEIDPEVWASLNSDTSRPFEKPASGRIAVKVINHLGDEVMKVFKV